MNSVIRPATIDDLDAIVQLRIQLFNEAVDLNGHAADDEIRNATAAYFKKSFESDDCSTWVVTCNNKVVAVGSLVVFVRPPYPGNTAGTDAYLLNMYTLPEHRQNGYARSILQQAMRFAKTRGYTKIWLYATTAGAPMYLQAGFAPSDKYMEWVVE